MTASDILRAVAEAIWDAGRPPKPWVQLSPQTQVRFCRAVLAGLRALAESKVTASMVLAWNGEDDDGDPAGDDFRAMLRALIAEAERDG